MQDKDSDWLKSCCSGILSEDGHHSNDISSRTIHQIKLNFGRWHRGDMEIQNCLNGFIPISKMDARVAILKFFKQHLLPNYKYYELEGSS